MLGKSVEELADTPVFSCVINTNSPFQLDVPMGQGLMTMAQYGQAVIVTPFTLSGAMSPVTIAGALAQQHAEAMAGIVLTQIVRPGAPVIYGGFTSNVDMRTGSPAFGTPEYVQAAQASGQLARRLGLPFRSSNVTAANTNDAQAAYESQMALWGALTGQSNLLMHAAGWLGGGLTASFEKLIIDAEMLQMMAAYHRTLRTSMKIPWRSMPSAKSVRRGISSALPTPWSVMSRRFTRRSFRTGTTSTPGSKRGRVNGRATRANQIWKQLLQEYEQPPLDAAIDEALQDYVMRRKREMQPAD